MKPSADRVKLVPIWINRIVEGSPRVRTALRWTLLLSLILHVGTAPFVPKGPGVSQDVLEEQKTEYMKRIEAAKISKIVAKDIGHRITMPPPPPDPEGLIKDTLTETLTNDIETVVGNLLDVEVTSQLKSHVAVALADELKAAAKDIAKGELSEEEIEELQKKFRQKAHDTTVEALRTHRVKTQVERASLSTTEWYEKDVSRTLSRNMRYELFSRPHNGSVWSSQFVRGSINMHWGRWGFLGWRGYDRKANRLKGALTSAAKKWKAPAIEEAGYFVGTLKAVKAREKYDGRFPQWYSWQTAFKGQIEDKYPHWDEAQRKACEEKMKGVWEKAESSAQKYKAMAEEGANGAELKAARAACLAGMKALAAEAAKYNFGGRTYSTLNRAIRSRVLRGPAREKMYRRWVDGLVDGLERVIRRFARGQFKKGIIKRDGTVEEAMKAFPKQIVPLLERDMIALFPKKRFDASIFQMAYANPYVNQVTGDSGPPSKAQIQQDEAAMAKVLSSAPRLNTWAEKRGDVIAKQFQAAIDRMLENMLQRVLTGGLLMRNLGAFVEGVDYADEVKEKLDARARALAGRGQDMAKLTKDGVPNTSAPLVALKFGAAKGHGAGLQPVVTSLSPGFVTKQLPQTSLRVSQPKPAPHPTKWGVEEQAKTKPKFKPRRFESIPFLSRFPNLDGRLNDWGKVRPLVLRAPKGAQPLLVYAAWNYQGFFFGYQVKHPAERFYYPSMSGGAHGGITFQRAKGIDWGFRGDHFRVCIDTLDARNANRGEPFTQEFLVFPRGTDTDPAMPGLERIFKSQRDAKTKQWRNVKASGRIFPQQPPPDQGPDGSGIYRVTDFQKNGYTVEMFIPRNLFKVPVFAPGWYIGFDCKVAMGYQGKRGGNFQQWAGGKAEAPNSWGDLLMLGTDARFLIQSADETGSLAHAVMPGHSYLVTVIDPDRNVNLTYEDTVLVSAEVSRAGAKEGTATDVEVFILKETGKNNGIFRGYINTQPGFGGDVQGVVEVMQGQEVRFGYVDFANAKGKRNVVTESRLPVVTGVMNTAVAKREQ